jgi:hypothetical protein
MGGLEQPTRRAPVHEASHGAVAARADYEQVDGVAPVGQLLGGMAGGALVTRTVSWRRRVDIRASS